jgi:hypothetical protein
MGLGRFGTVMSGMMKMSGGRVGMMSRCLMITSLVLFARFPMVSRRVFVVLSG